MSDQLISVVVPVYNAENTITRCVESIVNQTYKNIQLILVNDGSLDSSLDICRQLEKKYSNIIVIDKQNEGVSETRNKGIAASKGEFLIFIDSDDYIDSDMCEVMLNNLNRTGADVCMCAMTLHKDDKIIVNEIKDCELYSKEEIARHLFDMYKTNYVNSPCNKLYKKELIKNLFSREISLGEDLLFNLDYFMNCEKAVFINRGFYHYQFVNSDSLTKKYRTDNFEIATKLYEAVTKYGNDNNIRFQQMNAVREVYLNSVFYSIQDLFYYCKDTNKTKKQLLKSWVQNISVREMVSKINNAPFQQKIIARMIRIRFLLGIRVFFGFKKFIAKLMH